MRALDQLSRPARTAILLAATCLGLALLAYIAASLTGVLTPAINAWTYPLFMGLTGAVTVARGVLIRAERLAWTLMGTAMLSSTVGWATYSFVVQHLDPLPYPSVSDGFWLATYALNYAGLTVLLRTRLRSSSSGAWLDGVTGALGLGALSSVLLVPEIALATGGERRPSPQASPIRSPIC